MYMIEHYKLVIYMSKHISAHEILDVSTILMWRV
jgi:hypothetical protein